MTNDPILDVQNLGLRLFRRKGLFGRKTFSHWALEDVSFTVNKGEVFGVIGRNGAGKSSLLKVLARIYNPDRGSIHTYGAKICLLSLRTGFINELTGRENAILSGMLMGNTRKDMQDVLPDIIAFSELETWIDQPISTYSSGMKARLGFSTAAYIQSDIILIDELMGVGDRSFKKKSMEKMEELLNSDKTIVYVSHSADKIMKIAKRSVWIEAGKSILCGPTEEINQGYTAFHDIRMDLIDQGVTPHQATERALRQINAPPQPDLCVVNQ